MSTESPPARFAPSNLCLMAAEKRRPHPSTKPRRRWPSIGYLLFFVMAAGFLVKGSWTAQAIVTTIQQERRAAEVAARPAEVSLVAILPADCPACYDATGLISNIGQSTAVKVLDSSTVAQSETPGAELILKHNLQRLPAIIVTGEVAKLVEKLPQLKAYGQVQNGAFVGATLPPPYVQLTDGVVRGEFEAVYISEKQCADCYDPTINRQALAQLGMTPRSEKTVDRLDREGRALVKKYALTTTPAMILTGDLAAYAGFDKLWRDGVGTIEPDGAYVFRSAQDRMGTYYDLTAKKSVPPKQATSAQ